MSTEAQKWQWPLHKQTLSMLGFIGTWRQHNYRAGIQVWKELCSQGFQMSPFAPLLLSLFLDGGAEDINMLMRVYPHSPQGHGRIECGGAHSCVRGLNGERVKRREAEGEVGIKKMEGMRKGEGRRAYTLLTTTSSHVPSFLGTYYSEAL